MNAATVATAEAKKQTALAIQREAELKATQIAQATKSPRPLLTPPVYGPKPPPSLALRQLEILPQIVPAIAEALANAKLINISGTSDGRGAAGGATDQITGVIQTPLTRHLPCPRPTAPRPLRQTRHLPPNAANHVGVGLAPTLLILPSSSYPPHPTLLILPSSSYPPHPARPGEIIEQGQGQALPLREDAHAAPSKNCAFQRIIFL